MNYASLSSQPFGPAAFEARTRITVLPVESCAEPLVEGIASPLVAGRCHSLVVTRVPAEMEVIATTNEAGQELVMAIRHIRLPRVGLQFHPESILTPQGGSILWRFVREAISYQSVTATATSSEVKQNDF